MNNKYANFHQSINLTVSSFFFSFFLLFLSSFRCVSFSFFLLSGVFLQLVDSDTFDTFANQCLLEILLIQMDSQYIGWERKKSEERREKETVTE